ncbi:alkylhydroperoxidase family enzyme [Kaistia hirudinis]|uniref:Alkylhydroperoxidase family enzyme n=1 Tax=Kaistia hirudinis TaxID=1293440 RepID=A0A840ANL7_9HYPH|nr:hypothetical protein [Kaistia hirudinis]MBB3931222.1 alkylhydroperoxidase family enzyme [Kaistia hirudinis]
MTEQDQDLTDQERALMARIDQLIVVHGGDLRGVIETLLLAYDDRREQISTGYVRRRAR